MPTGKCEIAQPRVHNNWDTLLSSAWNFTLLFVSALQFSFEFFWTQMHTSITLIRSFLNAYNYIRGHPKITYQKLRNDKKGVDDLLHIVTYILGVVSYEIVTYSRYSIWELKALYLVSLMRFAIIKKKCRWNSEPMMFSMLQKSKICWSIFSTRSIFSRE